MRCCICCTGHLWLLQDSRKSSGVAADYPTRSAAGATISERRFPPMCEPAFAGVSRAVVERSIHGL